jgi:FlaA1/EpsC-like NDP-sugar epimerase
VVQRQAGEEERSLQAKPSQGKKQASKGRKMSKECVVNALLSCFMHVGLALVLLVYLPVAFVCRLLNRLFVRPLAKGEDLRGKVVLVTGASSGIGEVSRLRLSASQPPTLFFHRIVSPASTAPLACFTIYCCTPARTF